VLVAEVIANGPDDVDICEEARREREMNRRSAQHSIALAEGRAHAVERNAAYNRESHRVRDA
jgi:hypothetical protein